MKTIFALLALSVSTVASSTCYLIFDSSNELVWRGITPPVSLETMSLNAAVQKIVPKGHLVISNNDTAACPALDLATPRKTMKQKAGELKFD